MKVLLTITRVVPSFGTLRGAQRVRLYLPGLPENDKKSVKESFRQGRNALERKIRRFLTSKARTIAKKPSLLPV